MTNFLYALGGVLAVFALFVATRPSAFRIVRSLTIEATPAQLFALLNDFHQWGAWSPWDKLDPTMQRSFSGPDSGKGASYAWVGNKKVGEGSMTILESEPDTKLEVELRFLKPFAATNKTIFTLEPAGETTTVTWAMEGNNGFMAKAFGLFVNMDELVGKDFAAGLAAMQALTAPKG